MSIEFREGIRLRVKDIDEFLVGKHELGEVDIHIYIITKFDKLPDILAIYSFIVIGTDIKGFFAQTEIDEFREHIMGVLK